MASGLKFYGTERPKGRSSFAPRVPLAERPKLAVVMPDDMGVERLTWAAIARYVGKHGLDDPVILTTHPHNVAARWGYWHWSTVWAYGSDEDELMVQECERLLVVGPKSDEMLTYYFDLAKYHNKKVAWAVTKEES
jgi:hypothetical protein